MFIGFKRIKELIPIAVLAIIALFITDELVITAGLYKFNNPLLDVLGAPLFHLIWAGAAGIVFIHYMKPDFTGKYVMLVFFTLVTLVLDFIAEQTGVSTRLGSFNYLHSALIDFGTLTILLFTSEGLYGDRIYHGEGLFKSRI